LPESRRHIFSAAVAVFVFAFSPLVSHAGCGEGPECDQVTGWARFTSITLELSEAGKPAFAKWRGRFDHTSNDIAIDVDTQMENGPAMQGTIAMVGGRVMLTKGLKLEPGYEIDALDGPILNMSLVTRLLGREFPRGPAAISKTNKIDRTDKVAIKYATPSAQGYIPAPWHLAGTVSRRDDGSVAYDLTLSFNPQGQPRSGNEATERMRMVGELSVLKEPVLPATMSLAEWTTYGVGPQKAQQGSSTVLDYGAKIQTGARFSTVADIRAYIADEFGPGKLDTTKDFTGDWKKKCDDNFGLKIIHYGDEGKYAVLFCGPGGCDDPARERLTYIMGDKAYEVVSADELLHGRSNKGRYIRCSKEPGEIRAVNP
jgi:hypothetical protein